ncbi:MAG: protein-disulfide reductase DsbD domain-containing protein [Cyclonatronaceae bacterium]
MTVWLVPLLWLTELPNAYSAAQDSGFLNSPFDLSYNATLEESNPAGNNSLFKPGDDEDLVKATLLTESPAIMPGGTLLAGVRLQMAEGWYVYWKNPGDSGIPTSVRWNLPEGFSSSDLMWPWPGSFYTDSFVSYGYKEEVVLFTELSAPNDAETGNDITVSASVTWLVCKDICIPGSADVSETVRVTDHQPGLISENTTLFDTYRLRLPVAVPGLEADATEDDRSVTLHLKHEGLRNADVNSLAFYCSQEGVVESGADQLYEITDSGLRIVLRKSAFIGNDISKISGVLYNAGGWGGNGMKALTVTVVLSEH